MGDWVNDSVDIFLNTYVRTIPFLSSQIDHVSKMINLPQVVVEKKLSQMILDKTLPGILDQGEGVVVLYESNPVDKTYEAALSTVGNLNKALDSLFLRAKKLSWRLTHCFYFL